jgi:hypothetical protein
LQGDLFISRYPRTIQGKEIDVKQLEEESDLNYRIKEQLRAKLRIQQN